MGLKDKINKVSAVGLISSAAVIAAGIGLENKELFGFENATACDQSTSNQTGIY